MPRSLHLLWFSRLSIVVIKEAAVRFIVLVLVFVPFLSGMWMAWYRMILSLVRNYIPAHHQVSTGGWNVAEVTWLSLMWSDEGVSDVLTIMFIWWSALDRFERLRSWIKSSRDIRSWSYRLPSPRTSHSLWLCWATLLRLSSTITWTRGKGKGKTSERPEGVSRPVRCLDNQLSFTWGYERVRVIETILVIDDV